MAAKKQHDKGVRVNKPASRDLSSTKKERIVKVKKYKRSIFNILILLGIFWLGINFGNGSIVLNKPISSNKSLPENLSYTEVERLYDLLKENYDGKLNVNDLMDGLKTGLVRSTGDPYTEYFNPEEAKKFNDQLQGTFSGIGAELGKDKDDNLIIVAPISGFPADKAGLRPQDIIVSVDGKSTRGMAIDEAVSQIRGEKGTVVKLDILRGSEAKEFAITREDIKVPSVKHEILPNNIGYIEITQFWTDTADLTIEAVAEFKRANVKGIIVDVRGNPGGSLDSSVDIASLWLPQGKVVLLEKRDGKISQTYNSTGTTLLENVPTIVLINEGSASASEILAGALKDNKAAKLLGAKSYGKGSVQQIINLNDGSEIKVTIARWYRPNGQNIDKKGIEPDIKVTMTEEDYSNKRDPQKDRAIQELLKLR